MFWKRTEKVTKASYDTMVERYEASIKSKDDTIGRVCTERDNARKTSEDMLARNLELQAKVQRLEAELAPLKAERDKRLAILSAANEARRLKAQQKAAA